MKDEFQTKIKVLLGVFLFVFALVGNIIYAQGYGRDFRLYYFLWICNLSGILAGIALMFNRNEIILTFVPWTFFPFTEFIFDFWNVVSMPEWVIIAGAMSFVISILFLVKEKFFNFKILLFGIFLSIAFLSFTNNFFGINYPPWQPEAKIPLSLGILAAVGCLGIIFYKKLWRTKRK
ncbi:MAG: hypothetical protein QXU74_02825 [Candidatus Aenigmatarchaeota archaeon]